MQKQVLEAKAQIEDVIFEKKVEAMEAKIEAEREIPELKELYRKREFEVAVKKADDILKIDPDNEAAANIKAAIKADLRAMAEKKQQQRELERKKQEMAAEQKRRHEELQRQKEKARAAAQLKKKQAQIDRFLRDAERHILDEQYRQAADKLKEVLVLAPQHDEALRLLEYIKIKLHQISDGVTAF